MLTVTAWCVMTGKFPFEGHAGNVYDLVLSGQRPELPHYVDERNILAQVTTLSCS